MQENIGEVCGSQHGIKVILSLLHGGEKHLPPHAVSLLHPPTRSVTRCAPAASATPEGADGAAATPSADVPAAAPSQQPAHAEGGADAAAAATAEVLLGVSKKDESLRRHELLGSGKGSLAESVLAHCTGNADSLLRSAQGADLVVEAACGGGHTLWAQAHASTVALHTAVAAAVRESIADASHEAGGTSDAAPSAAAKPAQDALICNFFASRALRRLAQGAACSADATGAFQATLWNDALHGHCKHVVGTHGGKVLAGLIEAVKEPLRSEIVRELEQCPTVSSVDDWCSSFHKAGNRGSGKVAKRQP
jgi:hypothetical protein